MSRVHADTQWWITSRFEQTERHLGELDDKVDRLIIAQQIALDREERRGRNVRVFVGAIALVVAMPSAINAATQILSHLGVG